MDDYVEKLNNHPNVDDSVLTIFIHFWNVTIPVGGLDSKVNFCLQYTTELLHNLCIGYGHHHSYLVLVFFKCLAGKAFELNALTLL